MAGRTLFVGNLPDGVRKNEVETLFDRYGRIVDIDIKIPRRPPRLCFVTFEDARDAEDAIRYRDCYKYDGRRLRVERERGDRDGFSSPDSYTMYSNLSRGRSRSQNGGRSLGRSRSQNRGGNRSPSRGRSPNSRYRSRSRSRSRSSYRNRRASRSRSPNRISEDPRDAEDAIRYCNGYKYDGRRLRVERARGDRDGFSSPDSYTMYPNLSRDRSRSQNRGRSLSPRRDRSRSQNRGGNRSPGRGRSPNSRYRSRSRTRSQSSYRNRRASRSRSPNRIRNQRPSRSRSSIPICSTSRSIRPSNSSMHGSPSVAVNPEQTNN